MKVGRKNVLDEHRMRFGSGGREFRAPGRVNLIGEHTDYTGGLVMPMAIEFSTSVVLSAREDQEAVMYSVSFGEEIHSRVGAAARERRGGWNDYPVGVLWALEQEGIVPAGFNMTIAGDVPLGAGLSSSASIEVATAMALLRYTKSDMPLARLATLCRRAENEFVGAKSGIMDQFIVAGGIQGSVMMLDCRSLEYDLLPLPADIRIVICNSMVQHQVATGEYGDRRDEVERGQEILRRFRPQISMLRDATMEDLEGCADELGPEVLARCRHIVTENARVRDARKALLQGDMDEFGRLMIKAHESFRDDFAASCTEIDALVRIAVEQPGCYGARITGGGFGGCTVNLVRQEAVEQFVSAVRDKYKRICGIEAQCFVSAPSDGALALAAKEGGEPVWN